MKQHSASVIRLPLQIVGAVLGVCIVAGLLVVVSSPGSGPRSLSPGAQASCSDVKNDLVKWDEAAGRCEPDVCNGAHLPDLLEVDGRVPAPLLCSMQLFDTPRTRQCLVNRRIILLGDSTMLEVGHDITLLMAGMSRNHSWARKHLAFMGRQPKESVESVPLMGDTADGKQIGEAELHFYATHRHMAAEFKPLNFSFVQRFMGAADPQRNSEGLSTFFHPDLQTELACLLGEQGVAADCRPPDVVLFNSALHDVYHHSLTFGAVEAYERHLATLMPRMRALTERAKTLWLGSRVFRTAPDPTPDQYVEHVLIMGLDGVARSYMDIEGVPFVDLATTMRRFMPVGTNLSEWTPDGRHYGSGAVYKDLEAKVTVSTLLTQQVLAAICQ